MVAPKGDHVEVMTAMLNDRDLTHGRLLLGLAAVQLHAVHGSVRWKDAARAAVGNDRRYQEHHTVLDGRRLRMSYGGALGWLHEIMKVDRPRYQPPRHDLEARCSVPTARKAECGRPIGTGPRIYEPDQETGELRSLQFCWQHRHVAYALQEEIRARPPAPRPAANRGGVLARYIDTDWQRLYRWADPQWTMPPAGPPRPRPKLTVLVTDETEHTPAQGACRPALSLA